MSSFGGLFLGPFSFPGPESFALSYGADFGVLEAGEWKKLGSYYFRMQIPLLAALFYPALHYAWCPQAQSLLTSTSAKNQPPSAEMGLAGAKLG